MSPEELALIGVGVPGTTQPIDRPSWSKYFLAIAETVATRSLDVNSRYGCVLVRDNRILATGYNSPVAGLPDAEVPNTRLGGYKYMGLWCHAEENAILYAARFGVALNGATAVITGMPCHACSRLLISVGIKRWCIGTRNDAASHHVVNPQHQAVAKYLRDRCQVSVEYIGV